MTNALQCKGILLTLQSMQGEAGGETMRIGHYILGRTIGKGGFAKVKEARHELTGLPVAVKIINKLKMKNKNMISKVTREIKILKFINHPNIIKLYEVLDTTSDIFVVMQMAKGGELYEYIQKHDLTEDEVRLFFKQIIEGVEFAHLNLVAHRDLKPQNVLLDGNRIVKVADFGLSNLMKDGKLLRTNCGSLNYAAPQIIGRRGYEGTALDVWSCGVILYTMLTGSLPFDEEIVSILYKKIQTAEYTIPDYVSPLAADLIGRMLRVNPCKRIRISEIKLHPWLRREVPLYASLSYFSTVLRDSQFFLDLDVLARVRNMNMESLRNITDVERIGKIIRKRMDDSFVTVYELLKDEKDHANYYKQCLKDDSNCNPALQIFSTVPNKLKRQKMEPQPEFVYGKPFNMSSKRMIEVIFDIFLKMEISFVVKNNQYCVLCVYNPPTRHMRKRPNHAVEEGKIYGYQDEHRYTKHEIKFTLQLYSKSKNSETIVDLKLTQGHPLVFIGFSKQFYRLIKQHTA